MSTKETRLHRAKVSASSAGEFFRISFLWFLTIAPFCFVFLMDLQQGQAIGNYLQAVGLVVVSLLPGVFICLYLCIYEYSPDFLSVTAYFGVGVLTVPVTSVVSRNAVGYVGGTAGFLVPFLFYLLPASIEEIGKSLSAYSAGPTIDNQEYSPRYLVVGALVGLGFVAGENLLFAVQTAPPLSEVVGFGIGRGITVPVHVALSGIAGSYIGRRKADSGLFTVLSGIVLISGLHTLYNVIVIEFSPAGILLSETGFVSKLGVSAVFLITLASLGYVFYRELRCTTK